jgi:hypothetical protein
MIHLLRLAVGATLLCSLACNNSGTQRLWPKVITGAEKIFDTLPAPPPGVAVRDYRPRPLSVFDKGEIFAESLCEGCKSYPHDEAPDKGIQFWLPMEKGITSTDTLDRMQSAVYVVLKDWIGDSLKQYPVYQMDLQDKRPGWMMRRIPFGIDFREEMARPVKVDAPAPKGPLVMLDKLAVWLHGFPYFTGSIDSVNDELGIFFKVDSLMPTEPKWLEERADKWHQLVDHWALEGVDKFNWVHYVLRSTIDTTQVHSVTHRCRPWLRGKKMAP